jgi:hypothetical protein
MPQSKLHESGDFAAAGKSRFTFVATTATFFSPNRAQFPQVLDVSA